MCFILYFRIVVLMLKVGHDFSSYYVFPFIFVYVRTYIIHVEKPREYTNSSNKKMSVGYGYAPWRCKISPIYHCYHIQLFTCIGMWVYHHKTMFQIPSWPCLWSHGQIIDFLLYHFTAYDIWHVELFSWKIFIFFYI